MFLHIKDAYLDQAQAFLQQALAGRAEIYRVQQLIDQGFFGTTSPSAAFMSRVGNLVILPYAHETVWWYEAGRFEQKFYGSHGGLSREEMETLLLVQCLRMKPLSKFYSVGRAQKQLSLRQHGTLFLL